ncbi:Myosin-7B-like, partial [Oopsacas minuta]
QQPEERSYHIFYQLLRCIEKTILKNFLKSRDPLEYRILSKGIKTVDSINDSREFESTLRAMDTLGFTEIEINEKERRTNKALLRNHLSSYLVADRVGHLLGKKSEDLKKSLLTRGLKLGMNGCIKDDHLNR